MWRGLGRLVAARRVEVGNLDTQPRSCAHELNRLTPSGVAAIPGDLSVLCSAQQGDHPAHQIAESVRARGHLEARAEKPAPGPWMHSHASVSGPDERIRKTP